MSPFVREGFNDVGKEPCRNTQEWPRWRSNIKNKEICSIVNGKGQFSHILNGCPRHTQIRDAQEILKMSDNTTATTFLMLTRDPVDRIVSHLNDERRRGRRGSSLNVESTAASLVTRRSSLYHQLSFQGLNLKNLLSVVKDPSKILIIPMESLTNDHQGVIDAVMDHVHAKRYKLNKNESDNMHLNIGSDDSYQYITLSNSTREKLRNKFKQDVLLLEQLVGKRFSWSSWAREGDGADYEPWLVTTPNPEINITYL